MEESFGQAACCDENIANPLWPAEKPGAGTLNAPTHWLGGSSLCRIPGVELFQAATRWASLSVMTPIFDFAAAHRAQERARRLAGDTFLFKSAAEGLAERLATITRRFAHGLWIAPTLEEASLNGPNVPETLRALAEHWSGGGFNADETLIAAPGAYDLAVSLYSLQAVNDLPGALAQIRRSLKPDGLFLATLLGGNSLCELRDAFAIAESETRGGLSPRISPFADVRDLGGLLSRAGFSLPVADVDRLTVRYGEFFALVRDLRVHGFTNSMRERSRKSLRRDTLFALLRHYSERHSQDGRFVSTFETVTLTGWTPHESQQQPLKPGSAKARLAEALGAQELSAGEKPS
jgi:SAM-dependent methyltransferase